MFAYDKCQIKPPQYTPRSGIHQDVVHTIANVKNCFIYVWLHNRNEFWFYPVIAKARNLHGYMWNGRYWVNTRINMDYVKSYLN